MTVSLFYYYKKVLIFTSIQIVRKKLIKHHYLKKEDFNLNVEDITDANNVHAKRVCKDFEIKQIRRISWFVRMN